MANVAKTISVDFSSNNITYKDGDSLMVNFNGAFKSVVSFDSYSETTSPVISGTNYYMTNVRWSLDDLTWSPWQNLIVDASTGEKSLPPMTFDAGSNVNLEFKLIRVLLNPPTPDNLSLGNITIKVTEQVTESDTKAPKGTICPTGDYYKGIKVDCADGLFRVYDLMAPAIDLNRELSLAVSEMFGHQVCYFKTTADQRSKDFILKEYSLYNVTDVKNVRIVVPDNVFPDNAIMYTPFDMDFESPFEVQIVKEDFEKAFGYCVRPEERDYLYFPLENRLYEIQSAYLFKDFMRDGVYYKVNLFKWQDKDNVMRPAGSTAATLIDSLTENFDDLFKVEDEKEFTQITKPLQYDTINIGDWDFVRSLINENLEIKKHDINNYFTIVAKYAYDLHTTKTYKDLAVRYKTTVDIKSTDDRVFMYWFRCNRTKFKNPDLGPPIISEYPIGSSSYGLQYDTMFDGYTSGTAGASSGITGPGNGLQFNIQYGATMTSGVTSHTTQGIELKVNGTNYLFNENYLEPWPNQGFPNLLVDAKQYNQMVASDSRKWFALVVNLSNQHSTINCNLWEMTFDANKPAYTQQSTQLRLIFGQTLEHTPQAINSGGFYDLIGAPIELTNVRILKELINEENQPLMLNRYTVRDNQYAEMIDNALPPLLMNKQGVR